MKTKNKIAIATLLLCGGLLTGVGFSNINTETAFAAEAEQSTSIFEVQSAALRIPDVNYGEGIRFTIVMDKDTYTNENVANLTTGILIAPTYALDAEGLVIDSDITEMKNVTEGVSWAEADGVMKLYVHLYGIPDTEYATEVSIRAYVDDGDVETDPMYTDVATSSVSEAASWLYANDTTLSDEEKVTLKATYLTYGVFFHDGEEVEETTGVYGEKISAPEVDEKAGYTFAGWWNKAGTAEWNFDETTISGTKTNLYAKWNINTYTAKVVRVDGSEETVEFTVENRAEVLAGIALTANDAQYTYAWATALPSELALNNDQVFTETRTVNNYVVSFNTDGGSAVEAQTVPYGTTASALANFSSEKAGYTFVGWTFEDGSAIPEGATVTENVTVKAKWDIITYSAKVVRANGNEETVSFTIVDRADKLAAIALTANDAQYTYTWATALPSELALNNDQVFTETRTVNNYTVSFDVDGGSAVEAQTVPYGGMVTVPEIPVKDGYIFDGWDYDFQTPVMSNITITAKWVKELSPIEVLRVGEDTNTVLFYDRAIGAELQTGNTESLTYGYTTEKAWANEEGSLKIVTNASSQSALYFNAHSMEWSAGDYVSFYVYSEKDIRMALLFAYTAGVELVPNAWTKVTVSAEAFFAGHFRFYQHKSTNSVGDSESVTLYMSKVVLISGDDVKDLTVAGTSYTLGETTFSATGYNNGKDNNSVFNDKKISDAIYRKPMLIDGELVVTYFATNAAQLILTLADGVEVAANEEVFITVEMYDYGRLSNLKGYFNESGSYPFAFVSATPTENGYANVVFRCAAKANAYTLTSIRIDAEDFSSNQMNAQFRIKSVSVETNSIADLRTGEDANTVLFYDRAIGAEVQTGNTEALSYEYTTEKAWANESGSLKIVTNASSQSALYFNGFDMEWSAGDYVSFYVYSEKDIRMALLFAYTAGVELVPNAWTKVTVSAEAFFAGHFRFYQHKSTDSVGDSESVTLYMSKVVLISGDDVKDLTVAGTSYTLGETTFSATGYNNGKDNNSVFNDKKISDAIYRKPMLIDGELVVTYFANSDPQLILTLADSIDVAVNEEVFITVEMYDYGRLNELEGYLNQSGNYHISVESVTATTDGYANVVFKCVAKAESYTITSIRIDTEDFGSNQMNAQFRIKSIAIECKDA